MTKTLVKKSTTRKAKVELDSNTEFKIQPKASKANINAQLSEEERQRMIAEAAYFIAEAQGFQVGQELEYWVAAEKQMNDRLGR